MKANNNMTNNILIEILSEEIPARFQIQYENEFKNSVVNQLNENNFSFEKAEVFSTPRRIALKLFSVSDLSDKSIVELKGPKENAPQQAFDGFLNKNNLSMSDLVLDGGIYYYRQEIDSLNIKDVISDFVGIGLSQVKWKKSMKFNQGNFRYARPINNAVICFNDKFISGTISISDLTITLNENGTYGHRFMGFGGINNDIIKFDFDNYLSVMENNNVIVCRNAREEKIKQQIVDTENKYEIKLINDENLLEEVIGLVEYPQVLVGKIDDKFLHLPKEVIQYTMKEHQKFFSFNCGDDIAPYFALVSNIPQNNIENNLVLDGNKKVLRARLSDALFFFDNDIETSFESCNKKLENVIFHKKIGSTKLLNNMALSILNNMVNVDDDLYEDAILSSVALKYIKVDLVSNIVSELPYLQGKMGGCYASNDIRKNEILEQEKDNPHYKHIVNNYDNIPFAIENHYKPLGPSDFVPQNKIYALCALADKLTTLCALWLVGEKPTGSKDPFAIRRYTLGIIRIINENELSSLNIFKLINDSFSIISGFDGFISKANDLEKSDGLEEFFVDRIKNDLKSKGVEISVSDIRNSLDLNGGSIPMLYKSII